MFKTKGQPFGDFVHARKKHATFPKLLQSGWIWKTDYYEVSRVNAYVPPQYSHQYEETINLSEEDFIVFKLSNKVDLTSI